MTVIAGVDIGNATTEVVLVRDGAILAARRVPTRGRKGSGGSLRAAAALVRRLERETGVAVDEARVAPLRAVDTSVVAVPAAAAATGRFRVLAAGVPTPGGSGVFVGRPVPVGKMSGADGDVVAVVPPGVGYLAAAARIRELIASGVRVGAVLAAGDEGVLIANRLPEAIPVLDQADTAAALECSLLAVEVRPLGRPLTLLADPVALSASFGTAEGAVGLCATLLDYSNAVIGLASSAAAPVVSSSGPAPDADDVFSVDLAEVADAATARRGSLGNAVLTATLRRHETGDAGLPDLPVRLTGTEAAAARAGVLTTAGAREDAWVADLGAGTIDVIAPGGEEAVLAGGGDLLTAAVAEALGVPRAAADWIKRGPCVRVDGGGRYEAEDGSRGFLDSPVPPATAGMLAVPGPGGLLPFGARHGPGEWRAIRVRLKQAILAANALRAVRALGGSPRQLLLAGGPAEDDELVSLLVRSLPGNIAVGRGDVGGGLPGGPLGCRYAVALGLALQ